MHTIAKTLIEKLGSFKVSAHTSQIVEIFGEEDLARVGLYPTEQETNWESMTDDEVEEMLPELFHSYFKGLDQSEQENPHFRLSAIPYLRLVQSVVEDIKKALHIFTQPSLVSNPT